MTFSQSRKLSLCRNKGAIDTPCLCDARAMGKTTLMRIRGELFYAVAYVEGFTSIVNASDRSQKVKTELKFCVMLSFLNLSVRRTTCNACNRRIVTPLDLPLF